MSLGKRLAEARKALGMSQVAFAERCDISDMQQLNIEKDRNLPGSAYLLKLAELGVDVNYVLTGMTGAMTPEESVLLNAFRAADPSKRGELLALVLMGKSVVSTPRQSMTGGNLGQMAGTVFVQGTNKIKASQKKP